MLDFLQKNKFADIAKLYNIIDITDMYILQKINNKLLYTYIFEVTPITIIDVDNDMENNISNCYIEFLKSISIPFQIYMKNEIISIKEYFSVLLTSSENMNKEQLKKLYIEETTNFLNISNTVITKYYLIFSVTSEAELTLIENSLKSLISLTDISKIEGMDNLENFIYESINMVQNVC